MSDETGTNTSLITNFKNKIAYNLHKASYDPEANKFAEGQTKKAEEPDKKTTELVTTDATTDQGDPNKFNLKRTTSKVWNQTTYYLRLIFVPFIGLMMAMIVANEMIVYSVPIRIIFFIFVLILCLLSTTATVGLSLFYILKGGYSYYINHMTDKPNKYIMPTIFSLLPVMRNKPISMIGALFSYPFTYPKTENGVQKLDDIMKHYYSELVASFKYFDTVKNLPIFADEIKHVETNLYKMHEPKQIIEDIPKNNTNEMTKNENPQAPNTI
jgi:hypothetical protein